MRIRFSHFTICGSMLAFALVLAAGASAQVDEHVLFSFPKSGADGTFAGHKLYLDASGRLFGTANSGGANGDGTVFELSAPVNGVRSFSLLYQFKGGNDGRNPAGAVVFDASGNLYGAALGGAHNSGVIYKLSPSAGGSWTQSVIYAFGTTLTDGLYPNGLTIDAAGNLYGTTYEGGTNYVAGLGTVFELSPNPDGTWAQTVLYNFTGPDGALPLSELVLDGAGNLYGTTSGGGAKFAVGTVFELSPAGGGVWTEKLLTSFPYSPYYQRPQTAVWFDAAGNIYGTTAGSDSTPAYGSVFELTPNSDGSWSPKALHLFGGPGDGSLPAGLVGDANGNLFGTTASGGATGNGTVYELKKNASGQWIETIIHSFTGGADGEFPGTLTMGMGNALYGATYHGGPGQSGVIFETH
jgi:uncharacterized repeat protein (TIGR03803 family)